MDLLNLKVKSIKSQLSYLKLDLEYKQKMVEEGDKDFSLMMNEILEENPELKKKYFEKEEKRKEKIIEDILNKAQEDEKKYQEELESEIESDNDEVDTENEVETPTKKKDSKIKKLYRQIVKLTHPDKIKDDHLNSLYLDSTMYYDTDNLYGIYMICDELEIEYDVEESELLFMDTQVSSLKKEIGFIEGTYTWKWSTAPSEEIKRQVIIEFINMKLNQ